jgi:HAD superfamily hydrolase (TIGR01490 family)
MNTQANIPFGFRYSKPSSTGSPAAFFDVDGTLIPGTFGERIFIRYLLDNKVLTWKHLAEYVISVLSGGHFLRREAWEGNKTYLKGQRAEAIREWAEKCFRERILPRLSEVGLAAAGDHIRRAHRVFLVSASLAWLVEPLRIHLGAHGVLATRLAARNGLLTGETPEGFLYGKRKAKLLRRWISWWDVDASRSYAYSDHHSDIPLLKMVGHPVAVNPNGKLRRYAVRRGWPVKAF